MTAEQLTLFELEPPEPRPALKRWRAAWQAANRLELEHDHPRQPPASPPPALAVAARTLAPRPNRADAHAARKRTRRIRAEPQRDAVRVRGSRSRRGRPSRGSAGSGSDAPEATAR